MKNAKNASADGDGEDGGTNRRETLSLRAGEWNKFVQSFFVCRKADKVRNGRKWNPDSFFAWTKMSFFASPHLLESATKDREEEMDDISNRISTVNDP